MEEPSVEQLEAKVDCLRGMACRVCGRTVCGHEVLFDVAMGLSEPQCLACLARAMETTDLQLRDQLLAHFRRRACYGTVWRQESQREGFAADKLPRCLWAGAETSSSVGDKPNADPQAVKSLPDNVREDEVWDAGEMSCGDLVLALRLRLRGMASHGVLRLIAQDIGAKEDIPAWCRLTGHVLLRQNHPQYWIQRRD